ncbi:MAG: prepilin-type N-terminal cleavage/methylation domain-containing protein [Candidatus Gracilibacteria bacterium]|jgi:prepilin-type N-terminal cleavage/methylation domain-containing protein
MIGKNINKNGFTLVELLIAISIFVTIATISTSVLIKTINAEKLTDIRNTMFDDARVVMEQLSNVISLSTIDYEEYYSMNVVQKDDSDPAYGMYYGAYGSRFYNPGSFAFRNGQMYTGTDVTNPNNLGIDCAVEEGEAPMNCDVVYTDSKDKNVGKNPYDSGTVHNTDDANAFCDEALSSPVSCTGIKNSFVADELYLISDVVSQGNIVKMIFAKQEMSNNDDYGLVMATMVGEDLDTNNIPDFFRCVPDIRIVDQSGTPVTSYDTTCNISENKPIYYNDYPNVLFGDEYLQTWQMIMPDNTTVSYKYSYPKKIDHEMTFSFSGNKSFSPITPFRTSFKDVKFIINPVEDPYKAYDESEMRANPSVTILLTIEPSYLDKNRYPGGFPADGAITIQRTVTTGIQHEIKSFPATDDLDWVCEIFDGTDCPDYVY